jgi:hypothetical protein
MPAAQPSELLLHVLRLPDLGRAERIGELWGTRRHGPSGNLEEDKAARAVVFGLLAEMRRK